MANQNGVVARTEKEKNYFPVLKITSNYPQSGCGVLLTLGDRVVWLQQEIGPEPEVKPEAYFGWVRWIGRMPEVDEHGWTIGVEFDKAVGECDGRINGERYFFARDNHAIFLPNWTLLRADEYNVKVAKGELPGNVRRPLSQFGEPIILEDAVRNGFERRYSTSSSTSSTSVQEADDTASNTRSVSRLSDVFASLLRRPAKTPAKTAASKASTKKQPVAKESKKTFQDAAILPNRRVASAQEISCTATSDSEQEARGGSFPNLMSCFAFNTSQRRADRQKRRQSRRRRKQQQEGRSTNFYYLPNSVTLPETKGGSLNSRQSSILEKYKDSLQAGGAKGFQLFASATASPLPTRPESAPVGSVGVLRRRRKKKRPAPQPPQRAVSVSNYLTLSEFMNHQRTPSPTLRPSRKQKPAPKPPSVESNAHPIERVLSKRDSSVSELVGAFHQVQAVDPDAGLELYKPADNFWECENGFGEKHPKRKSLSPDSSSSSDVVASTRWRYASIQNRAAQHAVKKQNSEKTSASMPYFFRRSPSSSSTEPTFRDQFERRKKLYERREALSLEGGQSLNRPVLPSSSTGHFPTYDDDVRPATKCSAVSKQEQQLREQCSRAVLHNPTPSTSTASMTASVRRLSTGLNSYNEGRPPIHPSPTAARRTSGVLFRQLEDAIANGDHDRAATLARQLALIRQLQKSSDVSTSNTVAGTAQKFKVFEQPDGVSNINSAIVVNVYIRNGEQQHGPQKILVNLDEKFEILINKVKEQYNILPEHQRWVIGNKSVRQQEYQSTLRSLRVTKSETNAYVYAVYGAETASEIEDDVNNPTQENRLSSLTALNNLDKSREFELKKPVELADKQPTHFVEALSAFLTDDDNGWRCELCGLRNSKGATCIMCGASSHYSSTSSDENGRQRTQSGGDASTTDDPSCASDINIRDQFSTTLTKQSNDISLDKKTNQSTEIVCQNTHQAKQSPPIVLKNLKKLQLKRDALKELRHSKSRSTSPQISPTQTLPDKLPQYKGVTAKYDKGPKVVSPIHSNQNQVRQASKIPIPTSKQTVDLDDPLPSTSQQAGVCTSSFSGIGIVPRKVSLSPIVVRASLVFNADMHVQEQSYSDSDLATENDNESSSANERLYENVAEVETANVTNSAVVARPPPIPPRSPQLSSHLHYSAAVIPKTNSFNLKPAATNSKSDFPKKFPAAGAPAMYNNTNTTFITAGTHGLEKFPAENFRRFEGNPRSASRERSYRELMELDEQDLVLHADAFECPVCLTPIDAMGGIILRDCLHAFCRDCLIHAIQYTEEASVKCPFIDKNYSCESVMQDREIKALAPADIYEQHLHRSIKSAESSATNSFHCKTPDCIGWCFYEDNVNTFLCPVCEKRNCLTCQVIHEGLNCLQYQERLEYDAALSEDAKKTKEFLDEMVNRGEAMHCPQCQIIVMRKWGCDWLKCSVCRTEICWVTKGPRWGPKGKGDTSGGCKCGENGVRCHPKCNYCH